MVRAGPQARRAGLAVFHHKPGQGGGRCCAGLGLSTARRVVVHCSGVMSASPQPALRSGPAAHAGCGGQWRPPCLGGASAWAMDVPVNSLASAGRSPPAPGACTLHTWFWWMSPTSSVGVARAVALNGLQQAFARRRVAIPSVGGHPAAGVKRRGENRVCWASAPAGVVALRVCGRACVQPLLLPGPSRLRVGLASSAQSAGRTLPALVAPGFAAALQGRYWRSSSRCNWAEPPPRTTAVYLQPVELRAATRGTWRAEACFRRTPAGLQRVGPGRPRHRPGRLCPLHSRFTSWSSQVTAQGSGVGGLQCRVALVQGSVAVAVVGQRSQRNTNGVAIDPQCFWAWRIRRCSRLKQRQVGLVVADMAPGGVVAMLHRWHDAPTGRPGSACGRGGAGAAVVLVACPSVNISGTSPAPVHCHFHTWPRSGAAVAWPFCAMR